MRLQSLIVTGVAASSALVLTACNPAKIGEHRNERPMVAAVRLECPERQGELTRVSVAGDGRSCAYTGDAGEQVTLQLMALNAKPAQSVLSDLEAELKQGVPDTSPTPNADAPPASSNVLASPEEDEDGDKADRDGEHTRVNLPGLHIDANGDRAQINMPGVHISANGDKAQVDVDKPGGRLISIKADNRGAEIRTGEITQRNVDATYLLAAKDGDKAGERAVGYVARGPVTGPLVVGVVKSRGDRDTADDLLRSVKRLVRRNVDRG